MPPVVNNFNNNQPMPAPAPMPTPVPAPTPVYTPPAKPAYTPPPVMPTAPAPVRPRQHKALAWWLLIFLILIGLGAWYAVGHKAAPAKPSTTFTLKTPAVTGKLVDGFNPALIVVKDATIVTSQSSVSTAAAGQSNILFTRYTTGSSLNSVFTAYLAYMRANGYSVTKSQVSGSTGQIFATRQTSAFADVLVISVTLISGNKTQVDISDTKAI